MYTEERKSNLLKEFLLKLILIIIFVLLLIWLVPWPNMDSYMDALNPLKSQIFNSNIQEMKDAAITYFTSERLPQNVGDKKTLTLQQMLDMKLLIPFVDKNGDSCDVTASYVMIEKQETEYLMKVNLKCGEEENYILVHLGCYAYCTTDICEKKETIVTPVKPVMYLHPLQFQQIDLHHRYQHIIQQVNQHLHQRISLRQHQQTNQHRHLQIGLRQHQRINQHQRLQQNHHQHQLINQIRNMNM